MDGSTGMPPSSGEGSAAPPTALTTPDSDKLKRKRQPRNSACQGCAALKMKVHATAAAPASRTRDTCTDRRACSAYQPPMASARGECFSPAARLIGLAMHSPVRILSYNLNACPKQSKQPVTVTSTRYLSHASLIHVAPPFISLAPTPSACPFVLPTPVASLNLLPSQL